MLKCLHVLKAHKAPKNPSRTFQEGSAVSLCSATLLPHPLDTVTIQVEVFHVHLPHQTWGVIGSDLKSPSLAHTRKCHFYDSP